MMEQVNISAADFDKRASLVLAVFEFALLMFVRRPSPQICDRFAKLAAATQAKK